jgi:class 3 adenylate cyclase/tetratricopeptide (TPR) repeat protein
VSLLRFGASGHANADQCGDSGLWMKCSQCRYENPAAAKFCQQCGQALARACLGCDCTLPAAAKFCPECGLAAAAGRSADEPKVAPSTTPAGTDPFMAAGERRQATIVFADIAGYTRQCSGHDPEQVQAMLSGFFAAMDRAVEAYGGTVFDRAGDAVMAVFGAPLAHGNDAQRAVRAALDMHAAAAQLMDCDGQPLLLHIGSASGEVVAAAIHGAGTSKYSITGGPVNLAARLDALAAPGQTLISDALYRMVADAVDAVGLGERTVKGLAEPMLVWHVRALHAAQAQRLAFVGRQAELAQLGGALDAVRASGAGTTVVIRGDAGIGKSRLLEEIRSRALARGFATVSGQVLDFGVGKGQGAVPTLLKTLLGVTPPEDETARRAALQRGLASGLVSADDEVFLSELLDLEPPPALKAIFDALDNATRVRRSGEALAVVVRRAAALKPLLVCIEDIHWASAELLRHVAALAAHVAQAPMTLVLTSRIEGDPLDKAWRATIHGSPMLTLDLAPLRPQEALLFARSLIDASSRFALQCIERAEGNPLFLEQLLRATRESEVGSVPPTIQSLVLERMDHLPSVARAALQVAAVIGKRFSLADLRAIGGDPEADCVALVAADLVRDEGRDHQFAHALIHEAVYGSTLKSRRRELHLRAAQWFGPAEPVLRAEHLDRADDTEATHAYLGAARQQFERFRYDAALSLVQRGLERASALNATTDTVCALTLLSGDLLREMGRSAESIAAFAAAVALATEDTPACCHAWMGVAAGHRITGDFAQAMQALEQAQPVAERLGLDVELSRIHHTRGNLHFAQGNVQSCEAQHRLALEYARRCGSAECEVHALSGMGDAQYAQGRMRTALEQFRRCVQMCAENGWVRIEIPNRCMVAFCLLFCNRTDEAMQEAKRASEDAQRIGVVPNRIFSLVSLGQTYLEAGRFDHIEQTCLAVLPLARQAGHRRFEINGLDLLARVRLREGLPDEALLHAHAAFTLAHQTGLGFAGAWLCGLTARAALSPYERSRALREGEELLRQPSLAHNHLWFYRDAIETCVDGGDWDDVLRYADALEAFVSVEPLPWAMFVVERGRALECLARGNDRPAALHRLKEVRDSVAAGGANWGLEAIDLALQSA